MLVLTRNTSQSIMIGDDVEITVLAVMGDKVRIGIQAPRAIPVFRKEVWVQIREEDEAARRRARVRLTTGAECRAGRGRRWLRRTSNERCRRPGDAEEGSTVNVSRVAAPERLRALGAKPADRRAALLVGAAVLAFLLALAAGKGIGAQAGAPAGGGRVIEIAAPRIAIPRLSVSDPLPELQVPLAPILPVPPAPPAEGRPARRRRRGAARWRAARPEPGVAAGGSAGSVGEQRR